MAKVTTTITNRQGGSVTQFPNGQVIPRPALNTQSKQGVWRGSGSTQTSANPKKKFVLLDQEGKTVATLIDKSLAEQWVSDHKKGATRFIEGVISPVA